MCHAGEGTGGSSLDSGVVIPQFWYAPAFQERIHFVNQQSTQLSS